MASIVTRVQDFLRLESAAGLILIFAAILALIADNSFLSGVYESFLNTPMAIQIGALEIKKPLLLWINDGLMAVFFFLVGLEVKREVREGELSSIDRAALPLIAAVGGMAAPALFYVFFNWGSPETLRGWAIPAATDIAFALGILALLGSRVPVSLKVFLLAVAIFDDLGAILIIAFFYTSDLSFTALMVAAIGFAALIALNRAGVRTVTPFVLIGIVIWVSVLKSGVHATLAGVLVALTIPMTGSKSPGQCPLNKLEHELHPWVAFLVLPLFAFANAGVPLIGLSVSDLLQPVTLGIATGLLLGKQLGVFGLAFLATRLGIAKMPAGMDWRHLYGVACLTGIGFTMSLFIGTLAFETPDLLNQVRVGVLTGSIASGVLGYFVLRAVLGREGATRGGDPGQPLPSTS